MIDVLLQVATGVAVGVAAAGYAVMRRRLIDRDVAHSTGRTIAFMGGLSVMTVALVGPLDSAASTSFFMHSIQHVLLGLVAPPLLVLGSPATLALRAAPDGIRAGLRRLLAGRMVHFLTNPLVALALFTGGFFIVYLTPLYEVTLRNDLVHGLVHLHFVLAGLLFAWVVLGPPGLSRTPYPARLLIAIGTVPAHAVVAVALFAEPTALSGAVGRVSPWGWDALADQRGGIALMWVLSEVITFALVGTVLVQWRRVDERAAARYDRSLHGSG